MIAEAFDARDRRSASEVGRTARLELVFEKRGGRTVLAHRYAEPPFRVGRTFPEGDGLHMIMASSAPGIFGGDLFEQVIRVEPGARVRLTSQSALQAHPSAGPGARLHSSYQVADEASLHCHWDPLIPFAGARFSQRIDIALAQDARLYWSDAFMSGRSARGERWAFETLAHELRVRRASVLEYLERYQIVPSDGHGASPWLGGDCCYFGTTLVSGGAPAPAGVERLHTELSRVDGLYAAADAPSPGLFVARLMAAAGPTFHEARARLSLALRRALKPRSLRS